MMHMRNKSKKKYPTDEKGTLSPEFTREIRRRIADANDPVRYVVFSDMLGHRRLRLWLDVSSDTYGMSIDQATLFKRKNIAQAVARSCTSGRGARISVAKISTKGGKRKLLKIEK